MINPDSKQEQTIAQTPAINGYSWSPKGKYIIFSKEEKTDRYQQHNPDTFCKIDIKTKIKYPLKHLKMHLIQFGPNFTNNIANYKASILTYKIQTYIKHDI